MSGGAFGLGIFALLFGAAMAAPTLHPRLPERQRDQRTQDVIRLAVGMIVVMTSLLLGILTGSVKDSFEAMDRSVRRLAADVVLLDRALHLHGPPAAEARARLHRYAEATLEDAWPSGGAPPNRTVVVTLLLCTASIAAAMFLIIELDRPFRGLLVVSDEPLRLALEHMRR